MTSTELRTAIFRGVFLAGIALAALFFPLVLLWLPISASGLAFLHFWIDAPLSSYLVVAYIPMLYWLYWYISRGKYMPIFDYLGSPIKWRSITLAIGFILLFFACAKLRHDLSIEVSTISIFCAGFFLVDLASVKHGFIINIPQTFLPNYFDERFGAEKDDYGFYVLKQHADTGCYSAITRIIKIYYAGDSFLALNDRKNVVEALTWLYVLSYVHFISDEIWLQIKLIKDMLPSEAIDLAKITAEKISANIFAISEPKCGSNQCSCKKYIDRKKIDQVPAEL